MSQNLQAFLDTIAWSEGTSRIPGSDNGYNVLVGGALFYSYADHPRIKVWLPKYAVWSTAAGRYQILARYWDSYRKLLDLEDFSPASQDAVAVQMIKERGAYTDVMAGHFEDAIQKCRNLWASLPGAGYGQHENALADLQDRYFRSGGTVA